MSEATKTIEASAVDPYTRIFETFSKERKDQEPSALGKQRAIAMGRVQERGFPGSRDEQWRHFSLRPILSKTFQRADSGPPLEEASEQIRTSSFGSSLDSNRFLFVNGRLVDSNVESAAGLTASSLTESLADTNGPAAAHFAKHAPQDKNPFAALNTALFSEGAFIHVAKNTKIDRPIQVVYATAPGENEIVTHPRLLVVLEDGAQATIVESYVTLGEGAHFTNPVAEFVVGNNAHLLHYRVHDESKSSYHVSVQQFTCARDVFLSSNNYNFGGSVVRNDGAVMLGGEGCHGALNGLYVLAGRQHLDNHTKLEHAKANCDSRELFKGILMDKSHAVFNGLIHVWPDAQKTDSVQSNPNILLSRDARVDTQPSLEIYADDVKCTHGATIGQIEPEQIFYLQARGISKKMARSILTHAFAQEVIDKITVPELKEAVRGMAERQLSLAGYGGAAW